MIGFLKRAWIPLLVLVVVVVSGFTVHRIRSFFGSDGIITTPKVFADDPKPFDPKVVKYEIWGPAGSANLNYLDLDAKPKRIDDAPLPWSLTMETSAPSAAPILLAQSTGDSISCRITVDDEVKDERTATGVDALTYCFVKSA